MARAADQRPPMGKWRPGATEAQITDANLTGANLDGAKLYNFIGADFTGALNVPER